MGDAKEKQRGIVDVLGHSELCVIITLDFSPSHVTYEMNRHHIVSSGPDQEDSGKQFNSRTQQ